MQPANHMDVTPHILGLTFSSRRGWNPQGRTVCFIGRALLLPKTQDDLDGTIKGAAVKFTTGRKMLMA
jgi:hypothetical protein